jgi:hypothetical protein
LFADFDTGANKEATKDQIIARMLKESAAAKRRIAELEAQLAAKQNNEERPLLGASVGQHKDILGTVQEQNTETLVLVESERTMSHVHQHEQELSQPSPSAPALRGGGGAAAGGGGAAAARRLNQEK